MWISTKQRLIEGWSCQQKTIVDEMINEWKTRMVQLPATAAIEYVAACWVSGGGGGAIDRGTLAGRTFSPGVFCPGGLLSGGLMPVPPKFNAYTNRLGFLCLAS